MVKEAISSLDVNVSSKLDAINTAIGTQSTTIGEIVTKLTAVNTSIESGLSNVNTTLGLIKTAVKGISSSVTTMDSNMTSAISDINTSLNTIASNQGTEASKLSEISTALNTVVTKISELKTSVDGLNPTDYSTVLGEIKNQLAAIATNTTK